MIEQGDVCFEHGVTIAWKGGDKCPACIQIKKLLAEIIELKNRQKVTSDEGIRNIN